MRRLATVTIVAAVVAGELLLGQARAGGDAMWHVMQEELDRGDDSWEPAVHAQTHPKDAAGYAVRGYQQEILECRKDVLARLHTIPHGQRIFEQILTCGYNENGRGQLADPPEGVVSSRPSLARWRVARLAEVGQRHLLRIRNWPSTKSWP